MGKGRSTGGAGGGTKAKVQQQPQGPSADSMRQFFDTATPAEADQLLSDLRAKEFGEMENHNDIQRFMNEIGWTDRKPEVLDETAFVQAYQDAGNPQRLYHADNVSNTDMQSNSRVYSRQFMGNGKDASGNTLRQYVSDGYYGGGTYFAQDAWDSASYGNVQFRGFLNSNARVVDFSTIERQMQSYESTHAGFSRFVQKTKGGYGGRNAKVSMYAAMQGYNVISNGMGYYTILDRSAVTVSSRTELTRNIGKLGQW